MLSLFKKKLHKDVVLAIAVPTNESQFEELSKQGSDFLSSLKKTGWDSYAKTAKVLTEELGKISVRGVNVIKCFDSKSFELFDKAEIIIVIAHHTQHGTIELFDGEISEMDFVKKLPNGFDGIVDLSSCQSKSLIEIYKYHYPDAHFLGVNANTSLILKTIIIENVIKLMAQNKTKEYFEAYLDVLDMLDRYKSQFALPRKEDVVFLGDKKDASVYAPASVKRGQDFIIQLFLYDIQNKWEVDEASKMTDEDSIEKNHKKIRIPLFIGDKIQVQLFCSTNNENFQYDKDIQEVEYDGDIVSFEFIVSVDEKCTLDAFIGKIKVAVNNEPAGDLTVKVKVGNSYISTGCDYDYTKHSVFEEKTMESKILIEKLRKQLSIIERVVKESQDKTEREKATQMMEVCNVCINMVSEEPVIKDDKYKTVFVSSTSDMVDYRDVALNQILSCEMHPEMYEYWGQDNAYPCYECCRRVKNSDVLLCILGPKYGYIEPTIGMSMTEIEYRTAMLYGKTILVYVQKTSSDSSQQTDFINEIREKRLVHFFDNENNLAESSGRELMNLKHILR